MSLYRNVVWFAKGMLEYTRSGFESAAKSFNPADLEVNCAGQSYIVTGANSGLGKAITMALAKRGGTVHMLCRNEEKANKARDEIIEVSGNQNLHVHIVDLSEPKQIHQFAQSFINSNENLNVLINNAGTMVNNRSINSEGLELNFATNSLGVHILTKALIPLLNNSVEPRVITISSGGMLVQKLDLSDLQFENMAPFDGTMAYAQTKRQQVIMTEKYAEKYSGIHFSTVNPGWADTPGVQSAMSSFHQKMKNKLRTPEEGADTAVWLAVSQAAIKHPSGLFYLDRKPSPMHLPLAWTKSNKGDDDKLITILDDYFEKFSV